MGPDSSIGGCGRWRGFGRATAMFALAIAAIPLLVGGCGDSGHGAETDPEKGNDAAILNDGLTQELTIVSAYARGLPLLRGPRGALGRQLLAQEQEYVDGLTKAIRGLGGDTEAEAEELDFTTVKDQRDLLSLLYELENGALSYYLGEAAQLDTTAPRTLDTALAAGHAQHLVVLRQALGASPVESIPEGFDAGESPPPGGTGPAGGR